MSDKPKFDVYEVINIFRQEDNVSEDCTLFQDKEDAEAHVKLVIQKEKDGDTWLHNALKITDGSVEIEEDTTALHAHANYEPINLDIWIEKRTVN